VSDERPARYGPRLSAEEYRRRLAEIHDRVRAEATPSTPPAELARRVRALELDLAVDRRLGVDFPGERRKALLRSREGVEQRRAEFARRLTGGELTPAEFATHMQAMVDDVVEELSSVLTAEEVRSFLGVPDLGAVTLALDPDRIDVARRRRG